MQKFMKVFVVFLCLSGIHNSATCLADSPNDILIIANKNMKIDDVSLEELRQVFLKKKATWQKRRPDYLYQRCGQFRYPRGL